PDARHRIAVIQQRLARVALLRALLPATPVDPDNQRAAGGRRRGEVEIQPLPLVALCDVRHIEMLARTGALDGGRRRCRLNGRSLRKRSRNGGEERECCEESNREAYHGGDSAHYDRALSRCK